MRIKWSVDKETEHYVMLTARDDLVSLEDLEELRAGAGLRCCSADHMGTLGPNGWACLILICEKDPLRSFDAARLAA